MILNKNTYFLYYMNESSVKEWGLHKSSRYYNVKIAFFFVLSLPSLSLFTFIILFLV